MLSEITDKIFPILISYISMLAFFSRCVSAGPDHVRSPEGNMVPNLTLCARANFPPEAKSIVKMAEVSLILVVDKFGNVRSVENIKVTLVDVIDSEKAASTIPYFEEAARTAFGNRKCPPHYVDGMLKAYKIQVPLRYIDNLHPKVF